LVSPVGAVADLAIRSERVRAAFSKKSCCSTTIHTLRRMTVYAAAAFAADYLAQEEIVFAGRERL